MDLHPSEALESVWATIVWLTGLRSPGSDLPVCGPGGAKNYCCTLLTHAWNLGVLFDQVTRELSIVVGSPPRAALRVCTTYPTGGGWDRVTCCGNTPEVEMMDMS